MKKLTLIACALIASATMFAELNVKPIKHMTRETVNRTEIKKMDKDFAPGIQKQLQATYDLVNPYYGKNAEFYYCGPYYTGINTIPECAIIAPFKKQLTFASYYTRIGSNNLVNTWLVDDVEKASGVQSYTIDFAKPTEGTSSPLMKTASVEYSGNEYNFVDYHYGAQASKLLADNGFTGYDPYMMVAPAYTMPLTKMMFYTEDPSLDPAEDDPIARDYFWLGSGYPGDGYKYGTKLVDPFVSTEEYTKYIDTIFVPYFNDGTMFIDFINVGIVSEKASGNEMFPGENDHVRLSIYPITDKGIDFNSPIARATANADNFTGTGNYGLLQFNFVEKDPITGAETAVTATVDGPFVVALDEFNDGTANFGIFGNYFNPIDGDTYFVSNDSIFQLYDKASPDGRTRYPSQIMILLEAQFVVFEAPEKVTIGNEGGTIKLNIPSNVWGNIVEDGVEYDDFNQIDIDSDEWIKADVISDYELVTTSDNQQYVSHLFNNQLIIEVEPSSVSRVGTLEITALGKLITIEVLQGEEQGIKNVTFKNDNKMYNVLGIEVGEDYKGVVIRNGEKFVR